jgi:hypothetical protein
MTTISKDARLVTFINVFTVKPANQAWLVELLSKITNDFVRHARGFVASSLDRSLDGRIRGDAQGPATLPYFEQALAIAGFEPGSYEVVEDFIPAR